MTEYEINKAVAEKFLPCDYRYNDESGVVEFVAIRNVNDFGIDEEVAIPYGVFDPCNDVQQAWDIMLANNISVTKSRGKYISFYDLHYENPDDGHVAEIETQDEKPFVAAMLCFLEI